MEDLFATSLNERQLEAVTYCDGPLLVIAGAGAGKTRVLTYKVAFLLKNGYRSSEIMALTFTNKAAKELMSRVNEIIGRDARCLTWCGTFHSVFSKILRIEHNSIGFSNDFTIYDQDDSRRLIKSIIKDLGLDEKTYNVATINSRISDAKNRVILPNSYANSPDLLKRDARDNMASIFRIYDIYFHRCRRANVLDFDDLLLYTYILLKDHEEIRMKYQEKFRYILVDEFQDTNVLQSRILKFLMSTEDAHLCVVGDDAQSIYAFRGADIKNILDFQRNYPKARLIKLEQNYRSTQNIVNAANTIISYNKDRIHKKVFSELPKGELIQVISSYSDQEESMKVVKEISRLHYNRSLSFSDIAILYRTNAQSRSFENALNQRNIPYKVYGGLSFYQRKEIKDIIAYFRVLCNPKDDEALARIVNYPLRGIGTKTIAKLRIGASALDMTLWEAMKSPSTYGIKISGATEKRLKSFLELIEQLQEEVEEKDAYECAVDVLRRTDIIEDLHAEKTPEAMSRVENVDSLLNSIKEYSQEQMESFGNEHVPLSDFLSQVSLLSDQDSVAGNVPSVTLMTIHAAKGLEYDTVFVTGLEDNLFPNQNARLYPKEMEEERRLFYVAVTRAKSRCYLTYAKSRYKYGRPEFCNSSPFIDEISSEFISTDREIFPKKNSQSMMIPENRKVTLVEPLLPKFQRLSPTSKIISKVSESSVFNIKVGSYIVHDRFGRGVVHEISGEGMNAKAKVEFENVGEKNLLLKFAKFKIVEI